MPEHDDRPLSRWSRRLLGGRDSWRRIAATGVGGGIALAVFAALIAAAVDGSGSSSLDGPTPTPVIFTGGDGGPADTPLPPITIVPTPLPTQPGVPPTESPPTAAPPTEPPAPSDTPPLAPTETPPPEAPTATPEGGGA